MGERDNEGSIGYVEEDFEEAEQRVGNQLGMGRLAALSFVLLLIGMCLCSITFAILRGGEGGFIRVIPADGSDSSGQWLVGALTAVIGFVCLSFGLIILLGPIRSLWLASRGNTGEATLEDVLVQRPPAQETDSRAGATSYTGQSRKTTVERVRRKEHASTGSTLIDRLGYIAMMSFMAIMAFLASLTCFGIVFFAMADNPSFTQRASVALFGVAFLLAGLMVAYTAIAHLRNERDTAKQGEANVRDNESSEERAERKRGQRYTTKDLVGSWVFSLGWTALFLFLLFMAWRESDMIGTGYMYCMAIPVGIGLLWIAATVAASRGGIAGRR